jgi:hypothetical protein
MQSLAKFHAPMCTVDCGNPWRLELGIGKNRITVVQIATDRVDCHRLDLTAATLAQNLAIRSPLVSGLPRCYSCCGNLWHLTAELSK